MKPLSWRSVERWLGDALLKGDVRAAYGWAWLWDELPARPAPQLLPSALYYAEQGLRVFPLQDRSKVPRPGFKWRERCTSQRDTIIEWWTRWPEANVAVATGHRVDVIDIDGPLGVLSWARMTKLPEPLGVVSTPRAGGSHLYVAATGDGNAAKIFPGIDYRGLGGYVVAPPSLGPDGRSYSWRSPLTLEPS